MAVMPSSIHSLVTKSMALALILALTASLSHYAVAASGGAMGGGFSSHGVSGGSSSYRSRDYYSTRSGTTYVYRDCYCCSRGNYMLLRQNGNVGEDMDVFFYAVLASALIFIVVLAVVQFFYNTRSMKSVVKLQIALKGTACSLQQDLNHIARKANTSTREGYKYVLEEAAKALLRHSEFWLLSYLSEETRSDEYEAERLFYDLSFQERSKFDKETLLNIDNHQEQESDWEIASTSASPFIVVNLLVATARQLNLAPISTVSDLKDTLKKLGGLAKSEILAVHVLWTPQDENDHLSPERLHQDYPLLMDLRSKLD